MCKMYVDPRLQGCVNSFLTALGNHWSYPLKCCCLTRAVSRIHWQELGCWYYSLLLCSDCSVVTGAPERPPLQADTFSHAASTAGRQKWSWFHQAVRGYLSSPVLHDVIQFGNYLKAEQCTRGGFFVNFLGCFIQLHQCQHRIGEVVDWIKSKFLVAKEGGLAVLHNCNKKLNAFATTELGCRLRGAIISQSVTSCARMTACLVLLARTRVGFLSGGRGKVSINSHDKNRRPKKKRPCKGDSGSHSCTAALHPDGSTGHAWLGRSSDYHGLFEIWCLLQWAWWAGRSSF